MLKKTRDIYQQDFKIVDLRFVKLSLAQSCGSRQRDATSSGLIFQLNSLVVEGLMFLPVIISSRVMSRTRYLVKHCV